MNVLEFQSPLGIIGIILLGKFDKLNSLMAKQISFLLVMVVLFDVNNLWFIRFFINIYQSTNCYSIILDIGIKISKVLQGENSVLKILSLNF